MNSRMDWSWAPLSVFPASLYRALHRHCLCACFLITRTSFTGYENRNVSLKVEVHKSNKKSLPLQISTAYSFGIHTDANELAVSYPPTRTSYWPLVALSVFWWLCQLIQVMTYKWSIFTALTVPNTDSGTKQALTLYYHWISHTIHSFTLFAQGSCWPTLS